ncbi:hypothetical protein D3C79_683840 [compost metagenome]
MGRGAVDEPWPRMFPRRVETLLVHRHRMDAGAGTLQRGARTRVAGIFHPDAVAGIDEQLGRQQDALLGAGEDQDLIRLAHHPPRLHQIAADGGAKWSQALWIPVVHPVAGALAPLLLHQPPPERLGEEARIRLAGGEGVTHLGRVMAGPARRHLLAAARQPGRRLGRPGGGAHRRQGDEAASPHPAHQVALRLQPAVGKLHSAAGDAEIPRQHAAGGQPAVLGQVTGQDGFPQGTHQLLMQWQIVLLLVGKQGGQGGHEGLRVGHCARKIGLPILAKLVGVARPL